MAAYGLIGQVQEIESIHHFCTSPLLPYSWFHQLDQGGGALYSDFTHFLGQVLFITGATVQAVSGEARRLIERAPVGPPIHDLRVGLIPLTPNEVEGAEWQEVDADMGYTVMARLVMPERTIASAQSRNAASRLSRRASRSGPEGVSLYRANRSGFSFPLIRRNRYRSDSVKFPKGARAKT